MRYIELRRHTMRVKPGQHLSQAGVDLARRIGNTVGPFSRVITSTIPRAYETAIAMGFAVDEQNEILSLLVDGVEEEVGGWDAGFTAFAQAVQRGGVIADYARQQADFLYTVAHALPDDGAALVISHGGVVESQVVGCLPNADFSVWGRYCDYCEGTRLYFDGEQFLRGEVLRVNN
jgi:broad specificity phosphatase PhoE